MAQFTLYRSSDGSAPSLSGTAGDLTTLLDAVLVNGYGAKAAAGWTIEYTAANKRVYRPASGNRFYYRIDDTAVVTAKEARLIGYVTMSDVDTGTGPFPTVAQMTNGVFIRKSTTADATTRDWIVIADGRTCYVFVATTDTANVYCAAGFGDFYSLLSSDAYNSFVCARVTENSSNANAGRMDYVRTDSTTATNFFVARGISQTGSGIDCDRHADSCYGRNGWLAGTLTYPNIDGSALESRIWITETASGGIRGFLRGMWGWPHAGNAVPNGSTATGANELTGKTFLFINNTEQGSANASTGTYIIETSNTVDTN